MCSLSCRHTSFFARLISLSWGILEKGFKGLFVLVPWTSSVFRACPSKWRAIHLECWQTLQKAPVEVKIAAAYQTLQIIHLNFTYHWNYLVKNVKALWDPGLCRALLSTVHICLEDVLLRLKIKSTTSSGLDSLFSTESGCCVLTARELVSFSIQPGQVRHRPPLDSLTKLLF